MPKGVYIRTAQAKANIAAANARRRHSLETRATMSLMRRGIPKSPEHRAKIAASNKGLKRSAETRAKLVAMHRSGARQSVYETIRLSMSSDDVRKRMSAGISRSWEQGRHAVPVRHRYTTLAIALRSYLENKYNVILEPEVKFGRFTVDLYNKQTNEAFEADGSYWHDLHERKHPGYAYARDEYLKNRYGLTVIHFTDKEITALTGWPKKCRRTVA